VRCIEAGRPLARALSCRSRFALIAAAMMVKLICNCVHTQPGRDPRPRGLLGEKTRQAQATHGPFSGDAVARVVRSVRMGGTGGGGGGWCPRSPAWNVKLPCQCRHSAGWGGPPRVLLLMRSAHRHAPVCWNAAAETYFTEANCCWHKHTAKLSSQIRGAAVVRAVLDVRARTAPVVRARSGARRSEYLQSYAL
jgi:hypothetical protein